MKPANPGERTPGSAPSRRWIAVIILMLAMSAAPAMVRAQTNATQAVDPIVTDVVRMLEVGIEPDLILNWLQSSGKRPGPLSADDVIALSEAKAPKELIQALLDLATAAAQAPV
ncbi:MAG: hypothetical protein WBN65_14370, partial [Gammaproteobacteria bacterium]